MLAEHIMPKSDVKKVVLAYSGGLATSVILKWLEETYGCEVVTFTADIGQGEELEQVHQRALQAGALRAHVLDVREEFARDFVLPALQHGELRSAREPIALTLAHALVEPCPARGDEPHVDLQRLGGADRTHRAVFDDAQELHLDGGR